MLLRAFGIVVSVAALVSALRLAASETMFRRDTAESVRWAIAIQDSAEFEERLAELEPAYAREALARAVAIDPRASEAWIALGLMQEAEGNGAAAERSLLEAARVDRQFLPAWTLANFYFRTAQHEMFWPWVERAANLTYNQFPPLLRLCDQFEPDPGRLLAHFQNPDRLRPPYLNFLIAENRLDAAQRVAREMEQDRANDPHLIDLADRQLTAENAGYAMELWNAASGYRRIEPSEGRILTNGDLARAPLNLGFDWRLAQTEGVVESWRPRELIFTLSGSEPETCVLLTQTIWMIPGHFHLRFDYRTGTVPPTGVRWGLGQSEGPSIQPSAQWKVGEFDIPPTRGIAQLKLFYRREPGTTRAEGRIELRNLRLEASS